MFSSRVWSLHPGPFAQGGVLVGAEPGKMMLNQGGNKAKR